MKIRMEHGYLVESILVQNTVDAVSGEKLRMNPTTFTVGDAEDIAANPACGGSIPDSELFACGLEGKIIGIAQDNDEFQNLMEVRAYPWTNIAPTAESLNECGCFRSCAASGAEIALNNYKGWDASIYAGPLTDGRISATLNN